jgi:hypothetical protein
MTDTKRRVKITKKSVIERLWEVNREAEIWWDSSPIIYDNWRNKMIEQAPDKDEMKEWLGRLYSKDNKPEENIFRGVTARLAVEEGSPFGWERYAGIQGEIIGMDRFGAFAPAKELFREFDFTVENVVKRAERLLADR